MTEQQQIPFRVTELLCSRLCHDLISPVAAVSNGLELLVDENGRMDAEIGDLLGFSIGQATGWLTLFRVAYGLGGDNTDGLTLSDIGRLVDGVIEHEKMQFDPPEGNFTPGRDVAKLLLNMAMLGLEALPNRGRLTVGFEDGTTQGLRVIAEADGAALRPESMDALNPDCDPETLTARSVQSFLTAWLARGMGSALSVECSDGSVRLNALLAR
jgi:histidine phosphotransferase ChpT